MIMKNWKKWKKLKKSSTKIEKMSEQNICQDMKKAFEPSTDQQIKQLK